MTFFEILVINGIVGVFMEAGFKSTLIITSSHSYLITSKYSKPAYTLFN